METSISKRRKEIKNDLQHCVQGVFRIFSIGFLFSAEKGNFDFAFLLLAAETDTKISCTLSLATITKNEDSTVKITNKSDFK